MRVLVSGGTGFVGRALCPALLRAGHDVRVSTRDVEAAARRLPSIVELVHPGSPDGWAEAVNGCDAVINLAGESIAEGRWTPGRKRALRRSRIATTRSLVDACALVSHRPSVFVSASAVGYYGPSGNEKLDESAPPGDDFLARLEVELAQLELGPAARHPTRGIGVIDANGVDLDLVAPAFAQHHGDGRGAQDCRNSEREVVGTT